MFPCILSSKFRYKTPILGVFQFPERQTINIATGTYAKLGVGQHAVD